MRWWLEGAGHVTTVANVAKIEQCKQGTRQSLAAIFMTRTGSVQYRRPRVDKEEEVGAQAQTLNPAHGMSHVP